MTRLTVLSGGESSANFKNAINNNFAFLNSLTVGADGNNLVPSASSDFITDGSAYWTINGDVTWNSITHDITIVLAIDGRITLTRSLLTTGKKYRVRFKAKSSNLNERVGLGVYFHAIKNPELSTSYQDYEFSGIELGGALIIGVFTKVVGVITNISSGSEVTFDDIIVSEIPSNLVTLTTIDAQEGQSLCDDLNSNFNTLNNIASNPITLTPLAIGFTGSQLNSTFNSLNIALGKVVSEGSYFIEYYFSDLHYCTTRYHKILAFDDVDTLSLSLDDGLTFPYSLQIVGMENMIKFSYIFDTGVILFCTETHAYYSDDNLATYHECTVIGIDGNSFVPSEFDNYSVWDLGTPTYINGVEILVWGKAQITGDTSNVNIWETFDGKTIKSIWKSGVTEPIITINEIDNINYCPIDGSFWVQMVGPHWMKGIRNMTNGVWTWTYEKNGTPNDYYRNPWRSNGFQFHGEYVYWNWENNGIRRSKYVDLLDSSKHEIMFCSYPRNMFGSATGETDEFVHSYGYGGNYMITSIDGVKYKVNYLIGGEVSQAYMPITAKNTNGWYRADCWTTADGIFMNMYKGQVLMLRIVK